MTTRTATYPYDKNNQWPHYPDSVGYPGNQWPATLLTKNPLPHGMATTLVTNIIHDHTEGVTTTMTKIIHDHAGRPTTHVRKIIHEHVGRPPTVVIKMSLYNYTDDREYNEVLVWISHWVCRKVNELKCRTSIISLELECPCSWLTDFNTTPISQLVLNYSADTVTWIF